MSKNRSTIRVFVSVCTIIVTVALSVPAENSWGDNFFGTIREFLGIASSVSDDAVAVSNGPVIFQRGFAAGADFPFSRGGELYKVDPTSRVETFYGAGSQPNYSNDGSKIVFLNNAQITRSPAATYTPTGLTIQGGGSSILGFYPKWSPDGQNISYNTTVSLNSTLYYHVNIIGGTCTACDITTNTHQLNPTGAFSNIYASWHPTISTGTTRSGKIIFVSANNTKAQVDVGNYTGIFVTEDVTIAADGTVTFGAPNPLLSLPSATYAFPAYSHDGTKFAFVRFNASGSSDLMVSDATGANATVVVSYPANGNSYTHHPAFSPDDTKIVFSDSNQIFQVSPSGGAPMIVTNLASSANDLFPSWAPGTGIPTPTPTPTPTPIPVSDLELRFNVTPPDTVHLGQNATYNLIVNNNGPARAFGVFITGNTPPATLLDVGTSSFCNSTGPGGVFSCFLGDIDPGPAHAVSGSSVRTMTLQFRSAKAGQIVIAPTVLLDTTRSVDNVSANNSISATTSIKPDVELLGLEVTQVVQDLSNSVPLVADKKTFIRAYVRTTRLQSGAVMSANLVGTNSGGVFNGRLSPSNPGGTVKVVEKPQRSQLVDSFYFELPPDWIKAGNLQFRFESSDSFLTCSEPDSAPNCAATVTFNTVNPFSIKLLALTFTDASNVSHSASFRDVLNTANEMLNAYPISRFDGDTGVATTKSNPCLGFSVFPNIRKELNALRNTECKTRTCKQFYQGLLADQSSCNPASGANGESDLPGNASAVWAVTDRATTRIHEQGHALGLVHVDKTGTEACANASGTLIPCPKLEGDGSLSLSKDQFNINTAYGVNSSTMEIFPAETADFMSYATVRWPSRQNYVVLYNKMKAATSPEPDGSHMVAATQTVQIDGSVVLDGTAGTLGSVFVSTTAASIATPPPGAYAIRFENAQGGTLNTYSFDPILSSDNLTTGIIALQLPWDPSTKRIVLLLNGQILASRLASANVPTVRVTSPNGGENLNGASATFSWTAADTDGDTLTYALDYSKDNGATWIPLAANWSSTSFPVNPASLAGSNQALFRVTASDGFNTAQDQSDAVFTVPSHGPQAAISTPENNHLYVGDQNVNLSGAALDIEDGLLDGSRLSWSSNLNGLLGPGSAVSVNASTLVEGTHTIILTATDSSNRTATATKTIRVFRTRPVFPSELSVGSKELNFNTKTTLQTIPVRNSGDGTLTWSATADQPWIKLGDTTGNDQSNIAVTIIPGGLPFGTLSGKITITSPEAVNGPQVVNVNLAILQGTTVNLDGRVVTPDGRGLRSATVTMTDSQGVVRSATTSSFGFFSFTDTPVGETYTIRIGSRSYRFAPRAMQIISDLTLPDFVGLE